MVKTHEDSRVKVTLGLMESNPKLKLPQAMRAAEFTIDESKDPTLQMRVRRRQKKVPTSVTVNAHSTASPVSNLSTLTSTPLGNIKKVRHTSHAAQQKRQNKKINERKRKEAFKMATTIYEAEKKKPRGTEGKLSAVAVSELVAEQTGIEIGKRTIENAVHPQPFDKCEYMKAIDDNCELDTQMQSCVLCFENYHEKCREQMQKSMVRVGNPNRYSKSQLPVCYECHPSHNSESQMFDDWDELYLKVRNLLALGASLSDASTNNKLQEFLRKWNGAYGYLRNIFPGMGMGDEITIPVTFDNQCVNDRCVLDIFEGRSDGSCGVRKQMLKIAGVCWNRNYSHHREHFSSLVTGAFRFILDGVAPVSELTTDTTSNDVNATGGKQNEPRKKVKLQKESKKKKTVPSQTQEKIICLCCNKEFLHPFPSFVVGGTLNRTVNPLIRCSDTTEKAAEEWSKHGNKSIYAYPKQLQEFMSFPTIKVGTAEIKAIKAGGGDSSSVCAVMLTFHCRLFMTLYLHQHSPEDVETFYKQFGRLCPNKEYLQQEFYTHFQSLVPPDGSKFDTLVNNNNSLKKDEMPRYKEIIALLKSDAKGAVKAIFSGLSDGDIVLPSDLNDEATKSALVDRLMQRLFHNPRGILLGFIENGNDKTLFVTNDAQAMTGDKLQEVEDIVREKMKLMAKLIIVHFLHVRSFATTHLQFRSTA